MNTPTASRIEEIARVLTHEDVAEILTYTDEPELLCEPGEEPPVYPPEIVAAARLADQWFQALHLAPITVPN